MKACDGVSTENGSKNYVKGDQYTPWVKKDNLLLSMSSPNIA